MNYTINIADISALPYKAEHLVQDQNVYTQQKDKDKKKKYDLPKDLGRD